MSSSDGYENFIKQRRFSEMGNYQNAGAGLKKMFIASLGAVICTVLMIIPLINIIAAIAAIVFAVLSIVGLYGAGKDIEGCKTAFIITIINLVVSVLGNVFSSGVFHLLLSLAGYVLSFLSTYYVCTSVAGVMNQVGAAEVAQKGITVWKINLVCDIVLVVVAILLYIPGVSLIASIATIVIAIVQLVASILYMIFLNQSYKALGA